MTREGCGTKQPWLILSYLPHICQERFMKYEMFRTNDLVRVGIRTGYFQNMKQALYLR